MFFKHQPKQLIGNGLQEHSMKAVLEVGLIFK